MTAIDAFTHDSPEKAGGEYYERIAADVLQDLNLLRVSSKLHVSVDPKVPLFIVVGVIRKLPSVVKIRDIASVQSQGNRLTLSIGDESYLAPMLRLFWERFGKDHVEQPERFTVVLYDVTADPREIAEPVVADPSESLFRDLIYALRFIAPEGFRLRSEKYSRDTFSFVASENTLAEDIDALVAGKFAMIGEKP